VVALASTLVLTRHHQRGQRRQLTVTPQRVEGGKLMQGGHENRLSVR
jgi:hypothetical protein